MNQGLFGWPSGVRNDAPYDLDVLPVRDSLKCWLRSNDLPNLSNGDSVSLWRDGSGQGNDAVQATGVNQPTYATDVLRGFPVVRCVPTQWLGFSTPAFAVGFTEATVFQIIKTFDSSNWGHWTWGTDTVNDNYAHSSGIFEGFGTTVRKGPITASNPVTNWNAYSVVSKPSELTVRMNGTSAYTTATNTVAFTASPKIGTSYGGTAWKGDMAEFILYDRALTTQEIADVFSYLKAKWGTP